MTAPDTRAAALVRGLQAAFAIRDDMSARQVAVLALATVPPPELRKVGAIAEVMGVSRSTISRAADALQSHALLRRVPDRDDRRVVFLEATAAGRDRIALITEALAPQAQQLGDAA
jgi:DNA-binding MarR family transcriptional regulator